MSVVALVGLTAALGACGTMAPSGPAPTDFRIGSCRQVADVVVDVTTALQATDGTLTSARAVLDRVTADQDRLAAALPGLAEAPVAGGVRLLVTDLGLFRFTVDHHTYDGSQGRQVMRDVTALEATCLPSGTPGH